jgi:signal transduction histidine kinase
VRSFRSRLLFGSAIFVAGLLAIAHMASLAIIHHYPRTIAVSFDRHAILLVAIILVVIGFFQMKRGFSPFDELRARLAAVRDGRAERVEGNYPSEVGPLVDELNGLLEQRDALVRKAQAKAGDLAHGLKTPLAVLTNEVQRAEDAGQNELAAEMRTQLERMRIQLDYHLARTRAAAAGPTPGMRSSVIESANGLGRTLLRLFAGRGLSIDIHVPVEHTVRVQREDLDEMLGNLLDNACKWARSRVTLSSSVAGDHVLITIDDDGSGLDPAMHDAVLQRGVRADEATLGSGLGLAIVRDLADVYGGSIRLTESPAGGVRAELTLPEARKPKGIST